MSANFWARLNGDGASLRRFSGAAWSVVGRRRPILDWRTLMVDLRHVVRSGTATERYFGCNPSAGERRKWPRRRGNTRRDVRSRPLGTTHCVLRCTDCQKRRVPPIVAGGVQSWCAGAGGRRGGAGQLRVAKSVSSCAENLLAPAEMAGAPPFFDEHPEAKTKQPPS